MRRQSIVQCIPLWLTVRAQETIFMIRTSPFSSYRYIYIYINIYQRLPNHSYHQDFPLRKSVKNCQPVKPTTTSPVLSLRPPASFAAPCRRHRDPHDPKSPPQEAPSFREARTVSPKETWEKNTRFVSL